MTRTLIGDRIPIEYLTEDGASTVDIKTSGSFNRTDNGSTPGKTILSKFYKGKIQCYNKLLYYN